MVYSCRYFQRCDVGGVFHAGGGANSDSKMLTVGEPVVAVEVVALIRGGVGDNRDWY